MFAFCVQPVMLVIADVIMQRKSALEGRTVLREVCVYFIDFSRITNILHVRF